MATDGGKARGVWGWARLWFVLEGHTIVVFLLGNSVLFSFDVENPVLRLIAELMMVGSFLLR